jgi:phage regulator Rha-like protein
MNALTISAAATMSSREIAELTGKAVGHVNRDIEKMISDLKASGVDDPELDHVVFERDSRMYALEIRLPKELSITLVSGYSVVMRRAIIRRWQELEAGAAASAVALPNFTDPAEAAIAWASQYKAAQQAQIERDEAIKTKALIGSKREATAMATASAAKREASALRDRLGECVDHATVTAVQNATGERFDWLPLRRWCKEQGITPASVPDKRYGDVKSWPRAAWLACYGVRLDRLFGEAA